MRRREFIAGLGGVAAWPLAARAQPTKLPLIGFLSSQAPIAAAGFVGRVSRWLKRKGYVGSDDVTEYDRILESLLKDRLSSRRTLSELLNPTRAKEPKLSKAIDQYRGDRPPDGQLQLITGSAGTGKSLFTRRYKELLQPEDQKRSTHWAFIDFNAAPEPLISAQEWLCQKFVDSFHSENPQFDPYSMKT